MSHRAKERQRREYAVLRQHLPPVPPGSLPFPSGTGVAVVPLVPPASIALLDQYHAGLRDAIAAVDDVLARS